MARLLPPESAALDAVAQEVGIGVSTLERWRSEALAKPAREQVWTAAARFDAVLTTASMDEAGKSAWCRAHGTYAQQLRSDKKLEPTLSPRQREVLQLIAQGQSTKDIARLLSLSVKTIETHRSRMMQQLDIHEVTGLVRYAIKNGLISSL